MQLAVTVASSAARRRADMVIDADPGTAVAQIAAELDRLMHGAAVSRVPVLFVGGHQVPGDMRLADAPVLDGCVVSLGDPAGAAGDHRLRGRPGGAVRGRICAA